MPIKDDLLVLSVPVFIISVLLEAGAIRWLLKRPYPVVDAMGSMGTGIIQQLLIAFANVAMSWTLYVFIYERFALYHIDAHAAWAWVTAFVVVDFCYYWWHHASHKINFIWTGHLLHHQSEEFNLSTALRQSWFATLTGNFFYLPMAIAGFAPTMFPARADHTHDALPVLDPHGACAQAAAFRVLLFNSPSLHRVHHAINPRYLDKNFAGVFTLWDRMFGTYEPGGREGQSLRSAQAAQKLEPALG